MMHREKEYLYKKRDKSTEINLNDYFEINIKKENIYNNEYQNSNKRSNTYKNYFLITFLTSKKRPDIYLGGDNILRGNEYIVNKSKRENKRKKIKPQIQSEESLIEPIEELDFSNNYDQLKILTIRYYNYFKIISIKCFNCGEVGHSVQNCPNEAIEYCLRCTLPDHEEKDCPMTKCFKCNQFGHKSIKCPYNKRVLILCEQCKSIGHKESDCLANPLTISNNIFRYSETCCNFCGSEEHFICPFPKISKVFLEKYVDVYNDEEECEEGELKSEKRIFEMFPNEDIYKYYFCPICAGRHKVQNCKKANEFGYNEFDEKRRSYVKSIFGDMDFIKEDGGKKGWYTKGNIFDHIDYNNY